MQISPCPKRRRVEWLDGRGSSSRKLHITRKLLGAGSQRQATTPSGSSHEMAITPAAHQAKKNSRRLPTRFLEAGKPKCWALEQTGNRGNLLARESHLTM